LFGVLGEHLPDNKIIMNGAKPSDRLLLEVTCSTKRQNERRIVLNIAKLPELLRR
jgi:hypothetical protein